MPRLPLRRCGRIAEVGLAGSGCRAGEVSRVQDEARGAGCTHREILLQGCSESRRSLCWSPRATRRTGALPRKAPRDTSPRRDKVVKRLRGVIRNSRTTLANFLHNWENGELQSMNPSAEVPHPVRPRRPRGGGLFPCGPLESAYGRSRCPRSPRRAARWRRRVAAQELVRLMVGVSSWVSLGRPARCRGALPAPNKPPHVRALVHLASSSLRWIRLIESANDLVGSGRRGPRWRASWLR